MKLKEIKDMTLEEMKIKLEELNSELFKSKFQNSSTPLKNPMTIRSMRKDIARMKTIISERERNK